MSEAAEPNDVSEETPGSEPSGASSMPEAPKGSEAPTTTAPTTTAPLGDAPLAARPAYALAALSGFLYFLGFPGVDLWPISLVALVPLIVALRHQTPRRAAGLGWMAGFAMTMTGFYWLLNMLRVFSGFPTALCFAFMAILCAYQGGRIALAGWLYGRAERKGWPASIVFALAFASSELLYPLLFPWYFGASVHNAPFLMQTAEIGGPILVGLVLVAPSLAIAEIVLARREKRALDRRVLAVGFAVPVLAAVYGVVRMSSVRAKMASADKIEIGIVQGNQPLMSRGNAIQVHLARTKELKSEGAQLVVWSEGAVPRAFPEDKYEETVQKYLTRLLGVPTIVGGILARHDPDRTRYFNTAMLAGEGGKILGRYDKQFLLAFGEYLPLGDTFPILYKWSPNSGQFSSGKSTAPLVWGDHRISALICYEDILPGFVNSVVRDADPDLLVNLTNDAWFGDSTEPWIHLALAKLRAVEHRRYLVRATNSGVSAIVDANGEVVAHGKTFDEEALMGEARFVRAHTVYEMIGDVPWYLASIAVLAMGFVEKKRRGKAEPAAKA